MSKTSQNNIDGTKTKEQNNEKLTDKIINQNNENNNGDNVRDNDGDNVGNINEYNDEDTSEYDSESDDDLKTKFPNLSIKDGTDLYVVSANGIPQFYSHDIQEARRHMWNIARIRKFKEFGYNCYIRECNDENNIQLVGYYKFNIISYDRILCYLNVHKISELYEIKEVQKNTDMTESKIESTETTGFFSNFF